MYFIQHPFLSVFSPQCPPFSVSSPLKPQYSLSQYLPLVMSFPFNIALSQYPSLSMSFSHILLSQSLFLSTSSPFIILSHPALTSCSLKVFSFQHLPLSNLNISSSQSSLFVFPSQMSSPSNINSLNIFPFHLFFLNILSFTLINNPLTLFIPVFSFL